MKHYRSYMGRITAPAGLRQRVLEAAEQGARPRRPARRLTLRLAALSACCVLAVAGGRLLWLGGSAPLPPDCEQREEKQYCGERQPSPRGEPPGAARYRRHPSPSAYRSPHPGPSSPLQLW